MKQIVIVSDNRPGIVADVTMALGERGVNIGTIDGESFKGVGVVRMTVSNYDLALKVLRDSGFHAFSEEVILVCLEDKPGALARVARRFKDANIDITSLRIVSRDGEHGVVAISCEDTGKARELVRDLLLS
jgi:hypothetical protein